MNKELVWEFVGMVVGFSVSVLILMQLIQDIRDPTPSTITYTYLIGFVLVMAFWAAYGIRFKRPAIWVTNGVAFLFQISLLTAVILGA